MMEKLIEENKKLGLEIHGIKTDSLHVREEVGYFDIERGLI